MVENIGAGSDHSEYYWAWRKNPLRHQISLARSLVLMNNNIYKYNISILLDLLSDSLI